MSAAHLMLVFSRARGHAASPGSELFSANLLQVEHPNLHDCYPEGEVRDQRPGQVPPGDSTGQACMHAVCIVFAFGLESFWGLGAGNHGEFSQWRGDAGWYQKMLLVFLRRSWQHCRGWVQMTGLILGCVSSQMGL